MKLPTIKHFFLVIVALCISGAVFAQATTPLTKCDITLINKVTNASVKTKDGPATALEPNQQGTFSSQDTALCNPAQTTTTINGVTFETSKDNSSLTYTLSGKFQPTMPASSCSNQCHLGGKGGNPTWVGTVLFCVVCD